MKKKILSLLAAFFMLFGTSAMAQVDSTLEGDVNGDGVVDIADITAVIAIIKQNAEANPTYYWYVGTANPAEMTTIEPKVGDAVSNGVGFRTLDMSKTYSASNKLYDGLNNPIEGDKSATWYILLPTTSKLKFYDDLGESPLETITTTKDFGDGVKYTVYIMSAPRPVVCVPLYIYH